MIGLIRLIEKLMIYIDLNRDDNQNEKKAKIKQINVTRMSQI